MAFGEHEVFCDLSCRFPRGKISVILGGSGSGKSTLLRLIAGLIQPQAGSILVDGADVALQSERGLSQVRQKIGMMFQAGALLDSMTVFENLALPLREHSGLTAEKIREAVHDRLEAVGLSNVDHLLPGQLSGGMVKRVALARAIVQSPQILLCDEAVSGLDPISTKRIEALLVGVNRRYGMTLIVVSHHVPSTLRMADRVFLLLPDGLIAGTPQELKQSTDPRVVNFLNEDAEETPTSGEMEIEVHPDALAG